MVFTEYEGTAYSPMNYFTEGGNVSTFMHVLAVHGRAFPFPPEEGLESSTER
jgi:hypothetical protein